MDAVIVNDLARLGTRTTDHLTAVQRLHDAGVEIHVAKERATSQRDGLLVGVMQAYVETDTRLVGDSSRED